MGQSFRNLLNMCADQIKALFLVNRVRIGEAQLLIQVANGSDALRFWTAIVFFQDSALCWRRPLQSDDDQPCAFPFTDVRALLARYFRVAETVQEIVLKKYGNIEKIGRSD